MPKRFKRVANTEKTVLAQLSRDAGLHPLSDVPNERRPYASRDAGLLIAPQGLVYGPSGVFSHVGPAAVVSHSLLVEQDLGQSAMVGNNEDNDHPDEQRMAKHQRLWNRWETEVIPSMLKPFLRLLHITLSLREVATVRQSILGCTGCANGRMLNIFCIFMDKIEKLWLCSCSNIPLQLLERGLFPCAPNQPTLAVDLTILDLVQELFVNTAPNTTAWCETLERFLDTRGFKLTTRNSLRDRFTNSLRWYTNLKNTKNLLMRDYLDNVRESILTVEEVDTDEIPLEEDIAMDEYVDAEPERPSNYLRARCLLCFGGENWMKGTEVVDAIVCVDACFTQKRRKTQGTSWQAPHRHPETVFIPEVEVQAMEEYVENLRPSIQSKKTKLSKKDATTDGPEFEPGMLVPSSVLDGCNDSFIAADERRTKASTQFFSDTGLMGILCRHDRVLWLVNMTSAGEKQHYALTLIAKLFEHIPKTMRIGILYDIGCQLHRSCAKFGFLKDYYDRIVFGISVFHAYGHQWPCQLIYHPRKTVGFGLSDGEGCERAWYLISPLIPSCRVSSYFTRLYTIDTKIKSLDEKSLLGLGLWLQKKWVATEEKKKNAEMVLNEVYQKGIDQPTLQTEWENQVKEQTLPLKRQSKDLANKEIQEIMILTKNLDELKKELKSIEKMLETGNYEDNLDQASTEEILEELTANIQRARRVIEGKKGKLSIDGRLSLQKLLDNEFLKIRMNALALKQRIRDRLRQRKFEIENLERAYRATINRSKLEAHATQHIKKKEPGIQALARNYNKLCDDLAHLIQNRKAPLGAISPLHINLASLFKLDVDDEIWDDVGLTDDNDDNRVIPRWLGDDDVRKGIRALLELNRCEEEEQRLLHEKVSMQQWFREEWAVIITAINYSAEDADLIFQLLQRKKELLRLCLMWNLHITIIPSASNEPWGPTQEELHEAHILERTESVLSTEDLEDDSMNSDMDSFDGNDDDELLPPEDIDNLFDEAEILDNMELDLMETDD